MFLANAKPSKANAHQGVFTEKKRPKNNSQQKEDSPSSQQLYFSPNKGQWSNDITSIAKANIPGGSVYIRKNGIRIVSSHPDDIAIKHKAFHYRSTDSLFVLRYHVSDIEFAFSQTPKRIDYENLAPFYENYFLGNNPAYWKNTVQPAAKIILREVYPRIDIAIYFVGDHLEFDWILHPGSHPNDIALRIDSSSIFNLKNNQIITTTSVGKWLIQAPVASQVMAITKKIKPILCRYTHRTDHLIGLSVGKYDTGQVLTIDPILVFSTYSGSQGDNFGFTATFDTAGCLYSGGIVDASIQKYPVTTGAFQTNYGGGGIGSPPVTLPCDISISKYSADGSKLLYATYMGGDDDEYPHSLCVDSDNNLLVFGTTRSTNFPVQTDSAFSDIHQGDYDIFINKLSTNGTQLLAGTFIGGQDADGFQTESPSTDLIYNYADNYRGDITTDTRGNIYLATCTRSDDFPTTPGAFQSKPNGATDAAILCINPNLSGLIWSTLIGGTKDDAAYSIKIDDSAHVFVGGGTSSGNFPIVGNGFLKTGKGNIDGYVLRLRQNTGNYEVGTYWGSEEYDQVYFIDLDIQQKVYFTGQTEGNINRSAGTYGKNNSAQFIGRFDNDLKTEEFVTTFGNRTTGQPELSPSAFMVDNCYNIYFSGWGSVIGVGNSGSTSGLPITIDAHQKTTDNKDFYLIVLGKDAKNLKYASYYGGNKSGDHVDGGTSRFDKRGVIYQSVCASCPNTPPGLNDFPTSPANVAFKNNVSVRCSNASFKLDFRLGYAIDAIFTVNPKRLCRNAPVFFKQANIYKAQYLWDFGDGDTSHSINPSHLYKDSGTYSISLTVKDSNSCNPLASSKQTIQILVTPKGSITYSETICGSGIDFHLDITNTDSVFWNFGDGSQTQITAGNGLIQKNYQYKSGQYTPLILLKNTRSGCLDTLSIPVLVNSDSTHEILIANVFTPNGDNKNDCFRVFGLSPDCDKAELRVFNRWGERVFYTENLKLCWNGKVNNSGPELPSGTYFYQLDIIKSRYNKAPKLFSGSINLLRDQ